MESPVSLGCLILFDLPESECTFDRALARERAGTTCTWAHAHLAPGGLGNEGRGDVSNAGLQLSEGCTGQKFIDLYEGDSAETQFVQNLDDAGHIDIQETRRRTTVSLDNVRTREVVYQDNPVTGELASSGLRSADPEEPTVDAVDIVKTGDVFKVQ